MAILRDLEKAELKELVRWRNDPQVNRYLANRLKTLTEAEAWYERLKSNPKVWLKAILDNDRLIGYATVESIDEKNRKCELALAIGEPSYWGKGVGKQALGEMLKYAFETLHMHRVWAAVACGNERSERLVRGAGFLLEGTMREAIIMEGDFTDLFCFSLLENEYAPDHR